MLRYLMAVVQSDEFVALYSTLLGLCFVYQTGPASPPQSDGFNHGSYDEKELLRGGAEVFAWRAAHWNNWMFDVGAFDPVSLTITFGKGGFQGTRPGGAAEYFISHVFAELDAPNEFFLDKANAKLYYFHNDTATAGAGAASGGAPPSDGFEATRYATLISVNGTKAAPATDITINGVGFRDAKATYMAPHGVVGNITSFGVYSGFWYVS